jgi:hypothetical protein
VTAGRSFLNDAGVLPWTLWEGGTLPKVWWQETRFNHGIDYWHHCVMLERPSIEQLLRIIKEQTRYVRMRQARERGDDPATI